MWVDLCKTVSGRSRRIGLLLALFALCLTGLAVKAWVFWPVRISGQSMFPNYTDGQRNYINKLAYAVRAPQRGDVVGIRLSTGEVYLKRIIGLPGERIDFDRGTVVINGRPLPEPYIDRDCTLLWYLPTFRLSLEEYFVMGDNRRVSVLGPVPRRMIIGRAVF